MMNTDTNTAAVERWMAAHSDMCQAEQALFFFFVAFADGEKEFVASVDELVCLLGRCSRARFNYLASGLARRGLIVVEEQDSGSRWVIKERVNWTPAPLRDGELFQIPVSRSRARLRLVAK